SLRGGDAVIRHRGQRLVASRPDLGAAYASPGQANHPGAYADPCELAESGGDLLFDHSEESADAERFRDAASGPRALGVIRRIEQPHAASLCVEVHSTGHAGLVKTCGAALFSSFCCLGKRNRTTTTLFVKRTT